MLSFILAAFFHREVCEEPTVWTEVKTSFQIPPFRWSESPLCLSELSAGCLHQGNSEPQTLLILIELEIL